MLLLATVGQYLNPTQRHQAIKLVKKHNKLLPITVSGITLRSYS
jgi:lipoate synthase